MRKYAFFLRHPKLFIISLLVVTSAFALQLNTTNMENTLRMFFPRKHASWQRLLDTEETFGSMIGMGVALRAKSGELITKQNIDAVVGITESVEQLEFVDSVDSPTNIDYIFAQDGAFVVEDLVGEDYCGSDKDITDIKQRLSQWQQLYGRVILGDDGKAFQIAIVLNATASTKETTQTLKQIRQIVNDKIRGTQLAAVYFGDPVMSDTMKSMMVRDLVCLIPVVVIVVLLSLFISFKTLDGTILPLVTVLMSTIWSCGIMAFCHVTFTLVSSVIPVALIAVGSAYGIHVLSHYYIALDKVDTLTHERHLEVIQDGLKDVKMAVCLAGLTTIVGFLSLVTSPIGPLHSFAIFTALGVGFSLLFSVTLLPSILSLKRLDKIGKKSSSVERFTAKVKARLERYHKRQAMKNQSSTDTALTLYNIYHFFAGTRPRLIVLCATMTVLCVVGIRKLVVDTSLVNYFPDKCDFRQDLHYIDENFAGSNSLYFLVKGREKSDMCNVEILKALDELEAYLLQRHANIGKIVSFTTFLKKMNQVMHVPLDQFLLSGESSANYSDNADLSLDSFSFDSFDTFDTESTTDEIEGISTFDFGEEAIESSSEVNSVNQEWEDPLPKQKATLEQNLTIGDMLAMLSGAYAAEGGKNASVEDVIKAIERHFNFNGMAYYEVPYDTDKYPATKREELKDLVSQYLLLFSGSLDKFNDDPLSPKVCRVQLQLRTHSTSDTMVIIQDATNWSREHFPKGYTLEATGNGEMECVMTELVINSQIMSLVFSIVSVFIILTISFKSVIAGFMGCVPLAFTIILNYMVMGLTGIHLDFITSIIASVAVGVGIDYTIHFMTTYTQERSISNDIDACIKSTFRKSGLGIITNALAVGFGFLVLCLSAFVVLRCIGLLVAIVMFTSSCLAMTLLPGMFHIFDPKFTHKRK